MDSSAVLSKLQDGNFTGLVLYALVYRVVEPVRLPTLLPYTCGLGLDQLPLGSPPGRGALLPCARMSLHVMATTRYELSLRFIKP